MMQGECSISLQILCHLIKLYMYYCTVGVIPIVDRINPNLGRIDL